MHSGRRSMRSGKRWQEVKALAKNKEMETLRQGPMLHLGAQGLDDDDDDRT
jgi:hypothetical protein